MAIWNQKSSRQIIYCTQVEPTDRRPGSGGTFIIRLSSQNRKRLGIKNGEYVSVDYGDTTVLACLSEEKGLNDNLVKMDQTLRTALCLEKVMQGQGKRTLEYTPDKRGGLQQRIKLRASTFSGPSWLGKLLKQQYVICIAHHSMTRDMEIPLVRLNEQTMQIIGIQPGDKVLLLSETAKAVLRCLPLEADVELPFKSMGGA